MLELFQSVGAARFLLTWRGMGEQIARVRKHCSLFLIHRLLPELLAEAERDRLNLFVRPYSTRASLIQLDDLSETRARELTPIAFLTLTTSPRKAQAWIAVPAAGDPDDDRDFRRRVKKAAQSDPMASSSVRIAGSLNFKPKYTPDFPRVTITHATPGLLTSREARKRKVSSPPPLNHPPLCFSPLRGCFRGRKAWPDYQQTLAGAPPNQDKTGPDRSVADFTWRLTALSWGWEPADVVIQLRQVSAKAATQRECYAVSTAQQAARALASKQRQH